MISINIENIEELMFYDKRVKNLLPNYSHLFDQWRLAQQFSALRSMGKRSVLELLNGLTGEDLLSLEDHFGDLVEVIPLDHKTAKHYKIPLDEVDDRMCEIDKYGNVALFRDANYLYISIWR